MDKKNQILHASDPVGSADAVQPRPASTDQDYPKALYHKKDSKRGAPVSKLVSSAEEEKAAGDEWVPYSELTFDESE